MGNSGSNPSSFCGPHTQFDDSTQKCIGATPSTFCGPHTQFDDSTQKCTLIDVNSPCYVYDELKGPNGPNTCTDDSQCAGERRCSAYGYCEGDANSDKCK